MPLDPSRVNQKTAVHDRRSFDIIKSIDSPGVSQAPIRELPIVKSLVEVSGSHVFAVELDGTLIHLLGQRAIPRAPGTLNP
jgi:hypothetical protein